MKVLSGALAVFAAFAVHAATEPATEYEASVAQRYLAQRPLKSIGLAPFVCPAEIRCAELEKELIEELEKRTRLRVVGSKEVLDLMARVGIKDLENHEGRMIIGEALGLDSFAFVAVSDARQETVAPREVDKWKHLKKQATLSRARLELRIVARDGDLLAHVNGKAQVYDSVRSLSSVTLRLFAVMLERTWS